MNRKELESALLQVKGVISFLIDLYSQKAVIRTRTTAEALIQAISTIGMEASLRSFKATPSQAKENVSEPDYLDDAEDEVKDNSKVLSTVEQKEAPKNNANNNNNNNGGGWGWNRLAKALWG